MCSATPRSPDVLLASACLPTLFQAVEIDGETYWDGGYSGNPTITPLVRECTSRDTILVQINPVERLGTPRTARDILNRLNEVSFNAVLLKELRMIALLRQVGNPGDCEGALWAGMRIHRIASEAMVELGYSSSSMPNGISYACCAMRAGARPKPSWRRTARIWGGFPHRPRRVARRRLTLWPSWRPAQDAGGERHLPVANPRPRYRRRSLIAE